MPNNSESWQNEDIHFWMTEKSKQVLIEKDVAAAPSLKEPSVLIPVKQKYSNPACQHW
jgi:hypothetical protein